MRIERRYRSGKRGWNRDVTTRAMSEMECRVGCNDACLSPLMQGRGVALGNESRDEG